MLQTRRAVVLLSGGLDSTTTLAVAQRDGYVVHALVFDYGQRHRAELMSASAVAKAAGVPLRVVRIEGGFSDSALTGEREVPKDRSADEMSSGVPVTYVPARNTVFLAFALSYAESISANDIFIGVNALDYSGYPDCRPEFVRAFERMAAFATRVGTESRERLTIHAPLITLSKAGIVALGTKLGVDYALTHSCYDPVEGFACARCDSCLLRLKGFHEAGLVDPVRYACTR